MFFKSIPWSVVGPYQMRCSVCIVRRKYERAPNTLLQTTRPQNPRVSSGWFLIGIANNQERKCPDGLFLVVLVCANGPSMAAPRLGCYYLLAFEICEAAPFLHRFISQEFCFTKLQLGDTGTFSWDLFFDLLLGSDHRQFLANTHSTSRQPHSAPCQHLALSPPWPTQAATTQGVAIQEVTISEAIPEGTTRGGATHRGAILLLAILPVTILPVIFSPGTFPQGTTRRGTILLLATILPITFSQRTILQVAILPVTFPQGTTLQGTTPLVTILQDATLWGTILQ